MYASKRSYIILILFDLWIPVALIKESRIFRQSLRINDLVNLKYWRSSRIVRKITTNIGVFKFLPSILNYERDD